MSDQGSAPPGYYRAADGRSYPIPQGFYLASDGQLYPLTPPSPGAHEVGPRLWTLSSILLVGGSAAAAIGSFLPWVTLGPFTKAGTDGDGIITLILAIACGALAIPGARRRKRNHVVGLLIAAGLIVAVAIFDIVDVLAAADESSFVEPSIGGGLIITLLGGLAATVGALAGLANRG